MSARVRLLLASTGDRVEGRHRLRLAPRDPGRTRYRLWLGEEVEVLGVETPWGKVEVTRVGEALDFELPYRPYRESFEVEVRTRVEVSSSFPRLPVLWSPGLPGPRPPTQLDLRLPAGRVALTTAALVERRPLSGGTQERRRFQAGALPDLRFGPWSVRSSSRVELLTLEEGEGRTGPLGDFLEAVLARVDAVLGRAPGPARVRPRLVVVERPRGLSLEASPGRVVLDPDDDSWRGSWLGLARRGVEARWPGGGGETGWADEAAIELLARAATRAAGQPAPRDQGAYREGPLGPPPRGGWNPARRRWQEACRVRGVRVLRGLRAILGADGLRSALTRLAAAPGPRGTEALVDALPAEAGGARDYVRKLASGRGLDFRVEEIRGSLGRTREGFQEAAFRTQVRLRLGRGMRFQQPVPVPVLVETDRETVRRVVEWERPDQQVVVDTMGRVRRVRVDPQGLFPDPRPENNQLTYAGRYPRTGVIGG